MSNLQKLSYANLTLRIAQARRLNLATASDEAIARAVGLVMDGYITNRVPIKMNGIWRGRKNEDNQPFQFTRELWYPPLESAVGGRLNRHGQPMFYGTSVMQIVDKELKLEVGDNFTIMKAMTNQGMIKASLAHLGFHKRPAPSVARTIKEFIPRNAPRHQSLGHDLGIERKWEKVDDFLSDILTANSNYDESNSQYRLAQTIADVMLRISGVDGIAYPSVATSLKGINLCLLPEFVDASFRAKRFYMFQVLDRVNGDNLIATPAVNGVPDGERIVWAN